MEYKLLRATLLSLVDVGNGDVFDFPHVLSKFFPNPPFLGATKN